MADINPLKNGLIVTAFWEAKPGEVEALVGIIRKFLPQAQAEPGVLAFQIHQSLSEPTKFFFYEVFKDEAAFAEHGQAEHFKTLILEQAIPKLARRERRIVSLRYFGGFSQRRIAAELGLSQVHVSRLLEQSLGKLRAEIGHI